MLLKRIYKSIFTERQRNNFYHSLFLFRALLNAGESVYCPCCDGRFKQFLTYGNTPRENAVCPRCNALERNRVLWLYLMRELDIQHQAYSILHFAPEKTLEKRLKKLPNIHYIGADLNPQLADYQMDITQIPLEDQAMDIIICSHVLGHVPNEALAIQEIKRVLKNDGLAIIMTVQNHQAPTLENPELTSPEERLRYYGESDLLRLHGSDFAERLSAQGFQVKPLDYRLTFSESEQQRMGLGDGAREVLYLCRK